MIMLPLLLLNSVHSLYHSEFQKITTMKKDAIYRLKNHEKMPWRRILYGVAKDCRQNNLRILGLWGDDIIPLAMKVLGHPIEIGQHVGVDGLARRVGGRIQFCLDR